MADKDTILIVGLGNPGDKYEKTRHNAGFLALDYFADQHSIQIGTSKMHGLFGQGKMSGKKVYLLKPQTYMNRSGESVQAFMNYFQVSMENLLIVHDDLDLGPGKIKMVQGGGAGGHNGIRSLIQHLGSKDFARLKIGIGHPRDHEESASIPVEKFVLARFSQGQKDLFEDNLKMITDGIERFIDSGVLSAMNILNRKEKNSS